MACGQDGRAILPYYAAVIFRRYCLHHRCVNNHDSAAICGYDDDGPRRIHGICSSFSVDIKYTASTSSEGMIPYFAKCVD